MIPGLYYFPNWISVEEATVLQAFLEAEPNWISAGSSENARKVLQYGYAYDYKSGRPGDVIDPIPPLLENLRQKIRELEDVPVELPFNQCIVNKYLPGQGIAAHIDHLQFADFIVCCTLGSGGTMVFEKNGEKIELYTAPNSLYMMSGEARFEWKHSMVGRKSDTVNGKKIPRGSRTSVTFRSLLEKKS